MNTENGIRSAVLAGLLLAGCAAQKPSQVVEHATGSVVADMGMDAILYQHASAEVYYLYIQGYDLARMKLDRNLKAPRTKPPAVIVDVDETILDNSPYEVTVASKGATYTPETWTEWVAMESASPLPGSLAFLAYADSLGCAVFYITNRLEKEKQATIANLHAHGFPNVSDATVLCKGSTSDKTDRRALVAAAHDIVLLCGDQMQDMDERFKDRSRDMGKPLVRMMRDSLERYFVLFPDPMYGTWRDVVMGRGTDAEKAERMRNYFNENAY